jgi:hypothetical protein
MDLSAVLQLILICSVSFNTQGPRFGFTSILYIRSSNMSGPSLGRQSVSVCSRRRRHTLCPRKRSTHATGRWRVWCPSPSDMIL